MAVYKRTYKAYSGPLTPGWSRFTVLTRYGLSTLFNSRPFTAYTVLCFLPFLVALAYIYVVHSAAAQAVLKMSSTLPGTVTNDFFLGFLGFEAGMGFVLAAWGGPGMITKDFANHSVQLYLSRPISRTEYLLGKVSVMAALLSGITSMSGSARGEKSISGCVALSPSASVSGRIMINSTFTFPRFSSADFTSPTLASKAHPST